MALAQGADENGMDFVIIAIPNHLHYPVAKAFLAPESMSAHPQLHGRSGRRQAREMARLVIRGRDGLSLGGRQNLQWLTPTTRRVRGPKVKFSLLIGDRA
jgi:hypothetical protein